MNNQPIRLMFVAIVLAACGKKAPPPALTVDLVPPSARPLVLGRSVEADVIAKVPTHEINKDKSLGGTEKVAFNDLAAEHVSAEGVGSFWLLPGSDGVPRLAMFLIRAQEGCGWVKEHIGNLDGAERCPGNRKTGESGKSLYYCLSADDGRIVHVQCDADMPGNAGGPSDVIEYRLGTK